MRGGRVFVGRSQESEFVKQVGHAQKGCLRKFRRLGAVEVIDIDVNREPELVENVCDCFRGSLACHGSRTQTKRRTSVKIKVIGHCETKKVIIMWIYGNLTISAF